MNAMQSAIQFDVLLDRDEHVGEHGGAAGTRNR
jgi:hypothetical protein